MPFLRFSSHRDYVRLQKWYTEREATKGGRKNGERKLYLLPQLLRFHQGLRGCGICGMYAFSVRIWAEWSGADRRHTGGGGFEDGEAADRCE